MKNLFELGNQYAKESDWKDFALLKFCLCAVGIMIGTQVTPKYKKIVVCASAGVFIAAYIPLMIFEKTHFHLFLTLQIVVRSCTPYCNMLQASSQTIYE